MYIYKLLQTFIYIYSIVGNNNNLTVTSLEWRLVRGIIPPYFGVGESQNIKITVI